MNRTRALIVVLVAPVIFSACSASKKGATSQIVWEDGAGCWQGDCTTNPVLVDYGAEVAVVDDLSGGTPSLAADTSSIYNCSGSTCRNDAVGFSILNGAADLSPYAAGHIDFDIAWTSAAAGATATGGFIVFGGGHSSVGFSVAAVTTDFTRLSVSIADATLITGVSVDLQTPSSVASIYISTSSSSATPIFQINDVVLRAD